MMQGLPASGKSTKAKEIVASGDYIRVNRDLLREMLHFNRWTGRNEDATVSTEKAIAISALINGTSVVVDDCNLNPRNHTMWQEAANACGASFRVEKVDTPMSVCLERDSAREKAVGFTTITNMALQYGLYPMPDKGLVLCDLDGTLFDITHRLKYAKGEEKDWDKFFDAIPYDIVREDTVAMIRKYIADGHKIIFVSARPERCKIASMMKIHQAFGDTRVYETLIMRRDSDKRDDVEVKQQMYDTYFKGKYPIEAVIDDRPKVIRMWRANGVNVIDVGSGVEF